LARYFGQRPEIARRVFDLGCGNGSTAASLSEQGYIMSGVDPSTTGIEQAQASFPTLDLHAGSAYDDLAARFGAFPAVISLEVVEHLYDPKTYARCLYDLLEPGGLALVSTPYHGYLKNLALALTGRMDAHHNPLWDHGHIKFWSIPTLSRLLTQAGFEVQRFERVGRLPPFAKSMVAVVRRPR
jgi:2-polyprenyl-6-hydroxyphenyl methylase/3-demethylubiquinone-9 3-methyltransferase